MRAYRVSGKFRMGHVTTPYTIETVAANEAAARDRVLSTIGSRHRVDRHHVSIEKAVEIKPDEIEDAAVRKRLAMVK